MRIAGLLLVRDEAHNLAECVESLRGAVDAVEVFDTGSHDRTPAIARTLGAPCTALAWRDDFAGARNEALARLRADWALVIDADERLDREAGARLRHAVQRAADDDEAFYLELRTYTDDVESPAYVGSTAAESARSGATGFVPQPEPRLLRLGRGLRYEGRVSERPCRATGASLPLAAPVLGVLHHRRELEPPLRRAARAGLRLRLALRELLETNDARSSARLGAMLNQQGLWHAGLSYLRAARDRGAEGAALWLQTGLSQLHLGLVEGAIASFRSAAAELPEHPEIGTWLSAALLRRGRAAGLAEAGELLERVLAADPERELPVVLRAAWHRRRGEFAEARAYLHALLERNARHPLALKELGAVALLEDRLAEAEACLQHAAKLRPDDAQVWNNLGCAFERRRSWPEALGAFEQALRLEPGNPSYLRNRCIVQAACNRLGPMCRDAEQMLLASDDPLPALVALREIFLEADWLPALRRLEGWAVGAGWLGDEECIAGAAASSGAS